MFIGKITYRPLLCVITVALLILSLKGNGSNFYWRSTTSSNWNNSANWSQSANGPVGAGIPGANDNVIFDSKSLGNCRLDVNASINNITINHYHGNFNLAGFNLRVGGSSQFYTGTVSDSLSTSTLTIQSGSTTRFQGTRFEVTITCTSSRILLNGCHFSKNVQLTKTGNGNDHGHGGNYFGSTASFTNSSSGYLLSANNVADTFVSDLTVNNSGTKHIYLAYNSTGNHFGGKVSVNNTGSGHSNYVIVADKTHSSATFMDSVTILNTSSSSRSLVRFHYRGNCAFHGPITVGNTSSGYGIQFGGNGGRGKVASNTTFSIHNLGYSASNLQIHGLTLAQASNVLHLSGTALLDIKDSEFRGNVNFKAPRLKLNNSKFTSTAVLEKTGAGSDYNAGGNVFQGITTITNSGSGYFLLGGSVPDTFSTDLTVHNTGSYRCYLAHNSTGNYFGGKLRFINKGSGSSSYCYAVYGSLSSATFQDSVIFENSGSGGDRFYIAQSGNVTFNGHVALRNHGSNNSNRIYFNTSSGQASFGGNLIVESTVGNGIHIGHVNSSTTLLNGNSLIVGPQGFTKGYLLFRNFRQLGSTTQSAALSGTGYLYMQNCDWGGNTSFSAPRVYLRESRFRGSSDWTKTGTSNDACYGGNMFDGLTTLTNSSSSYMLMGNVLPDTFKTDVIANNTGSNRLHLAYNSSNNFFGGKLKFYNQATGSSNHCYFASGSQASATITDSALFHITGSGANYFRIGTSGTIVFNGAVDIRNHGTGGGNYIHVAQGGSGSATFNANLTVSSVTGSGIYFGQGGGSCTLTSGQTLSVGAGGYNKGYLYLRNFTQSGSSQQTLHLTGTAFLYNFNSHWGGQVDFRAPRHITQGTVYDGIAHLEKTGGSNDASNGGNWFKDSLSFVNSGTGYFLYGKTNADDHDGPVYYAKTSTGRLYPAYSSATTYAGNIHFNMNTSEKLAASSGRVVFDGNSSQHIYKTASSNVPVIRRMTLSKLGGELTLHTNVEVQTNLTFGTGIINTMNGLLVLYDNSTVQSASDQSHVCGPIEKIGNDAFVFPIGDSGVYMPVGISAPSKNWHRFRARYIQSDPWASYSGNLKDSTLDHISSCEYWMVDRITGNSNVTVRLNWKNHSPGKSCSGVNSLQTLRVARWNGARWKDHGNGGATGSSAAGSVVTSSAVTSFSPFTLASADVFNPLPIELLDFRAERDQDQVDIYWSTASEINNEYFIVERSTDGRNFKEIIRQDGAGNSQVTLNYSDVDLSPETGINYYRLKQVDYNGSYSYSAIIPVKFSTIGEIKVYPTLANPGDMINIEGSTISGYEFIDPTGKLIARGKILHNTIAIPVFASNGMYILKLQDDTGHVTTTRVVVNRR